MDALWKWLMRANARGVFLSSVLAFLLVASWWSWKEITRGDIGDVAVQGDYRSMPRRPLALLAVIQNEANSGGIELPVNPFVSPFQSKVNRRPLFTFGRRKPRPQHQVVVVPRIGGEKPKPRPTPRPKPKPKEVITLQYCGVFKRSDGELRALIRDSKSGRQKYYSLGDDIVDLVNVESFTDDTVTVTQSSGAELVLPRDQDSVFENGKYVNQSVPSKEIPDDGLDAE